MAAEDCDPYYYRFATGSSSTLVIHLSIYKEVIHIHTHDVYTRDNFYSRSSTCKHISY